MFRRWFRCLTPLMLTLALATRPASAQQPIQIERGHQALDRDQGEDGSRTAALPYVVAALSAMLVLFVVCTPTRKS